MQLPLTTILAALSAGALTLPTDGPIPAAQTPNARNGLPYSNFDLYNHTLPYNTSAPDIHTTIASDPHSYQNQTYHHNASNNTTTLTPRTPKGHKLDGDIASYSDDYCTVTASAKVYLAEGACVKFAPVAGTNIGINWGGSPLLAMQFVQTYTDDDCEIDGPKIVTPGSANMNEKGAGFCKAYGEFLKVGGAWRSVWMSASRS